MSNPEIRRVSAPLQIERGRDSLDTLAIDGRTFAYRDVGQGPTVLLAHCSGASHTMWAPLISVLSGQYRVIAPDLLGYGRSERWPAGTRLHPWSDLGALIALASLAEGPVHIVGHSYGGTVALEAARALGTRTRSLTLIEPIAFHLLRLTGRVHEWNEITTVGQRMIAALRLHRDRGAARVYMKYWAGWLRWFAMSAMARRSVVATVGKVGAEFEFVSRLSRSVGDYRSVNMPTRLIAGARTPRPARAIVDELAHILPDAHLRELPRAGHMSPITHPKEIATLVAEHLASVEAGVTRAAMNGGDRKPRRSIA